ncbi:MAG: 1,4-dihydroxy-2-naphthoate polyprenyltransferase [Actinomycetia bacterium]|nr:1,4-dihydroxy-2-naphthoate polyprenyltransferase [Actinomycetes bacterium]
MTDPKSTARIELKTWLQFARPFSFSAAYAPVVIGSTLAYTVRFTQFRVLLFLAMLGASVMIQAATNLFNEYYDFKRGLDSPESVGIGGALTQYKVQPGKIMAAALGLCFVSLLLGVYICLRTSWWVAAVGGVCMVVGYLYTGGPMPIAYTPLGEILSGFFMGSVIVGVSYFIQTHSMTLHVFLASLPTTLFIANILLTNNIRDLDEDTAGGRKTLAILLGRRKAIVAQAVIFGLGYAVLLALPPLGVASYWSWLALLSAVNAYAAVKGLINKRTAPEMMPAMGAVVRNNRHFGLLLALGVFFGTLSR